MPLEALRYDVTPVGLHYLLIHRHPGRRADLAAGARRAGVQPVSLTMEELRRRPVVTAPVTLECAGNGRARLDPRPVSQPWLEEAVGTAEWTGTPRSAAAGGGRGRPRRRRGGVRRRRPRRPGRAGARLRAQPARGRGDAPRGPARLGVNGRPLPPQHGYPLRLVVPGWYGMTSVKWLRRISVLGEPFEGYQQTGTYLIHLSEDDPGTPVTRIQPRSLLLPPGIPEFESRRRFCAPGRHLLAGRAWSGLAPVAAVEVSTDGGRPGSRPSSTASRPRGPGPGGASPGRRPRVVRALLAGQRRRRQHPAPGGPWNTGGYANNAVQRVEVTVRP